MPNISSCSKCNKLMTLCGFNNMNGEIVCEKCFNGMKYEIFDISLIKKLQSQHLDELTNKKIDNSNIKVSINFLIYH